MGGPSSLAGDPKTMPTVISQAHRSLGMGILCLLSRGRNSRQSWKQKSSCLLVSPAGVGRPWSLRSQTDFLGAGEGQLESGYLRSWRSSVSSRLIKDDNRSSSVAEDTSLAVNPGLCLLVMTLGQ